MRIGIDARLYGKHGRGIGRYVQELISQLSLINHEDDEYVVFLSANSYYDFKCQNNKIIKVLADINWYSFAEQIFWPLLLKRHRLDLMHFPHYNVPLLYHRPFIVTIHDLLLHRYPSSNASTRNRLVFYFKYLAYKIVVKNALDRAKYIIAVSHFTKKEILHYYPHLRTRIAVIYEGSSVLTNPKSFSQEFPQPYFLYVGAAYPHKNLLPVIKVLYEYLRRHNVHLLLVGRKDYFYQQIEDELKKLKWDNYVHLVGEVSDSDLCGLFDRAKFFLMPSLYEGFGLPPLEAMAAGCPVVAANVASLPEVLGQAALYFNPRELSSLIKVIDIVLNDEAQRVNLIALGKKRATNFSWRTMVIETRKLYNKLNE